MPWYTRIIYIYMNDMYAYAYEHIFRMSIYIYIHIYIYRYVYNQREKLLISMKDALLIHISSPGTPPGSSVPIKAVGQPLGKNVTLFGLNGYSRGSQKPET